MYKDRKRINKNGYVVVEYPEHHKSFDTGTGIRGVYEHVLVAEEFILGRKIKEGEVIHHLDSNRSNNSPENLLPMSSPSHGKLHKWMTNNVIIPTPKYSERKSVGCVRCALCEKPINFSEVYCSEKCRAEGHSKKTRYVHPDKEELKRLVWEKPTSAVAKDFNVSDKAIEKLCKKLGVDKPPRGYWNKVSAGKITTE